MSADKFEEWAKHPDQSRFGPEGYKLAKAAWFASRKAALEAAAKVCDQMHEREDDNCGEAAHCIRTLKGE